MTAGDAQFGVQPEMLTDLAGKFDRAARNLTQQVNEFSANASGAGQAFGLLGACDGACTQYTKLCSSTVKALGRLPQVLGNDGDRLRTNAANYSASDQAAVEHLQSVTRR
jgi:uncharacterized protein YukE